MRLTSHAIMIHGIYDSNLVIEEHTTSYLGSHSSSYLNYISSKDKQQISVDDIRKIDRLLSSKSSHPEGKRMIVIENIDELNNYSAAALLKNLEEPPTGTLFLLLAKNIRRIIPTIQSRCEVIYMNDSVKYSELPDSVAIESIDNRDDMNELIDSLQIRCSVENGIGIEKLRRLLKLRNNNGNPKLMKVLLHQLCSN